MCRAPVTLGGGMTMQNGLRFGVGLAVEVAALVPESSQRCWASFGSYCLGSSVAIASPSLSQKRPEITRPPADTFTGRRGSRGRPRRGDVATRLSVLRRGPRRPALALRGLAGFGFGPCVRSAWTARTDST